MGGVDLSVKKLIAYMVTWTTYGSWLQGEKKGYVKKGVILPGNEKLKTINQEQQKFQTVKFDMKQRQIVQNAILEGAKKLKDDILEITVCSNHVHIVFKSSAESIQNIVRRYKYASTVALRKYGLQGKIWSKGFDKRYCYTDEEVENKIRYVQSHN